MRAWTVVFVAAAVIGGCSRAPLGIEQPDFAAPDLAVKPPADLAPPPVVFAPPVSVPSGGGQGFLTVDLDGDGDIDLLGSGASNRLELVELFGRGDGTLAPPKLVEIPDTGVAGVIATPDLDRDGKVDALVLYFDTTNTIENIGLMLGRGDGTFGPLTSQLSCSAPTNYCFPLGIDGGSLTEDVNGDGFIDLILGRESWIGTPPSAFADQAQVTVLLGGPGGKLATHGTYPTSPAGGTGLFARDFDGDGNIDVLDSTTAGIQLSLGRGDGSFGAPRQTGLKSDSAYGGLAMADFDGDGEVDLLVGDDTLGLAHGLGGGNFAPPKAVLGGGPYPQIFVADFNDDGRTDFAVLPQKVVDGTPITVGVGQGGGQFSTLELDVGFPVAVTVADMNGDAKPDLIVNDGNDPARLLVFINLSP